MELANKGIEDFLFEDGKLSKEQLSALKIESSNTGEDIEELIKKRELVSPEDFAKAKAKYLGLSYINPSLNPIDSEVLDLLTEDFVKKNLLVPFKKENGVLYVAMADPLDLPTIELIERKTGLRVKPFMALPEKIQKTIHDQYGRSIGRDISQALGEISQENTTKLKENLKDVEEADQIVQDSSVARVVSIILEYAAKVGASDVHIEPQETQTRVRYRIDGVLQEKLSKIPKSNHDSIVARIKILADLKIDEKRKPQDGRFKIEIAGERIDLRVSTLPTVFGEKVVIRLLKDNGETLKLKDLGLRGSALKNFEKALLKPNGIILVTGPTGSGKTLTLATSIRKINTVRVNIMTLEDPVEIRIPGVNQVQVNPDAGLTFASGLRSFLRQDPDVIMVGEIRDPETAELAVQAALTGHLVLATLHTNSAAGSIPRLLDMHVENFLLASTINSVLAQRLVRKICPYCKERYEAPDPVLQRIQKTLGPLLSKSLLSINAKVPLPQDKVSLKEQEKRAKEFEQSLENVNVGILAKKESKESQSGIKKLYLYRGKGCDKCGNTGYKGRIGIFEVLDVDEKMSNLISGEVTTGQIEKLALEKGMVTLLQDGFVKALEGITSLEEVLRVAEE